MAITDTKIRTAKSKDKLYKLYDEKGLYVEVTATGSNVGGSNTGLMVKKNEFPLVFTRMYLSRKQEFDVMRLENYLQKV